MIGIVVLWASYVLSALLWSGLALAVVGAFTLTIALCRAASRGDGEASDLES